MFITAPRPLSHQRVYCLSGGLEQPLKYYVQVLAEAENADYPQVLYTVFYCFRRHLGGVKIEKRPYAENAENEENQEAEYCQKYAVHSVIVGVFPPSGAKASGYKGVHTDGRTGSDAYHNVLNRKSQTQRVKGLSA